MKKIMMIAAAMAFLCMGISADAHKRCGEDWKEKMMGEKIAFLTVELGLTPEEAQVFWPVYNQVEKEKDDAMMEVIKAYKELRKATDEGKVGKEISDLLDKYVDAQKKSREIDNGVADRYKAVLPVEKVAKLYVAEEKFRRHHIRNMKGGGPQGEGKPVPRK